MSDTKNVTNVLFCGTGGQGILTMAEVLCQVAVIDGYHVKKSEVHGMAQRGGSVESHVRFGKEVFSPLIPHGQADFLVCLDAGEHETMKAFLAKDGDDLFKYLEKAREAAKSPRYLNSAMLGVIASRLGLKIQSWESVFKIMFANKNLDENLKAFTNGLTTGKR